MSIEQEVLKAELPPHLVLFELDFSTTNIPALAGQHLYVVPYDVSASGIVFQGKTFIPWPCAIDNIEQSVDGPPARPAFSIGNIMSLGGIYKYLGQLAMAYNDLNKTTITMHETFSTYLSAGISVIRRFELGKLVSKDTEALVFELRSFLDIEQGYMPPRQMLRNATNVDNRFPGAGVNVG